MSKPNASGNPADTWLPSPVHPEQTPTIHFKQGHDGGYPPSIGLKEGREHRHRRNSPPPFPPTGARPAIPDWDDLRVFLALSRAGNLTAAAKVLGVSHPTIARRIKALEKAIGTRLFDRQPDRFVLTPAGENLLADAQAMEQAADSIARRAVGLADTVTGTVRVSAMEAMTAFLARHLHILHKGLPAIELELVANHILPNLSRREADLMIWEQCPDLSGLIARKLGQAAYAVYGCPELAARADAFGFTALPWAGFDDEHGYMPGQAWIAERLGGQRPTIRVNDWLVLIEVARTGAGLTVLPCYLGDNDPTLTRVGDEIEALRADQWLLVHHDLKTLPRIRAVITALAGLFEDHRSALLGRGYQGTQTSPP